MNRNNTSRPLARATRYGFTLVELLVVIAIIGVLIALLLPAVNAAREAGRRTVCRNNLMQVSIALQHYDASFDMLPPGTINPSGPIRSEPQGIQMSWVTQILPQLGHQAIARHIDYRVGAYDPRNKRVADTIVSTLRCPSEMLGWSDAGRALSSYAGCHDSAETPIDTTNNGVLFLNSQVRERDMTDGASYTLFIGEKRNEPEDLGWMSGTRATLRNTGTIINGTPANGPAGSGVRLPLPVPQVPFPTAAEPTTPTDDESTPPANAPAEAAPENAVEPGASAADAADTATSDTAPDDHASAADEAAPETTTTVNPAASGESTDSTDHERSPAEEESEEAEMLEVATFPSEEIDRDVPLITPEQSAAAAALYAKLKDPLYVGGFGSAHVGGANFIFGDGSVRFLSDSMDHDAFMQAGNRADGELPLPGIFND
jgi:prepilin-type N-terminal cleavage/methylation domain-containing protein/prepilin-type processing-associated H-X9-DG protein